MTATSAGNNAGGLTVAVVARDPIVRGSLVRALRECRVHGVERTIEQLARTDERPDVVCTGPVAAAAVLALHVSTVVVTRGLAVSDQVLVDVSRQRPVVIRAEDVTPVTLFDALMIARFGTDLNDVPPSLSWVPPNVLRAFLARPRTIKRIRDFARAAGTSPGDLRRVEKDIGCERFEHMAARLREDVWKWLVCAGVDRKVVEKYLGMTDRSHVRRACRSAQIPVPWSRE